MPGGRFIAVSLLLLVGGPAAAQPADSAPAAETPASEVVLDGAGYVGLVHYQDRGAYFDDRRFAGVLGGDIVKRTGEFMYHRTIAEIGGAADRGEKELQGFRFQLGMMGGLAFGSGGDYMTIGLGFDTNGDVKGAVPAALAVPIEVAYFRWLGSHVRAGFWLRGDELLAARRTRSDAADQLLFVDELTAGTRLLFLLEDKQVRGKTVRKGIAVGVVAHRTMGSTVWMLQLGSGAVSSEAR